MSDPGKFGPTPTLTFARTVIAVASKGLRRCQNQLDDKTDCNAGKNSLRTDPASGIYPLHHHKSLNDSSLSADRDNGVCDG